MIIDLILTILLTVTLIGLVHVTFYRQSPSMDEDALANYLEKEFSIPIKKEKDG